MLDLMIGIDGVQRRTRRSLDETSPARRRRVAVVRTTAATALRVLADRLEPVGTIAKPVARAHASGR
jgi:hypothetical protein